MQQNNRFRVNTMIVKGIIMVVVTILMLIPISMVTSLIEERASLKDEVTEEISSKWGGEQTIVGPVLVVPYTELRATGNSAKVGEIEYIHTTEYAYFLPDEYNVTSTATVEERARSIYNTLVYQTENKISGKFSKPKLTELNIKDDRVQWNDAFIMLGVPYMQGIKNKVVLNFNGKKLEATAGVPQNTIINSGVTIKKGLELSEVDQEYNFDVTLNLNGSEKLFIAPIGKENSITMSANWETVSLTGDFLATSREINKDGFTATWNIFDYNRNYVQMWKGENRTKTPAIGVELKYPVDQYKMSMRSTKYAIMFILLTFVVFFLVELITKNRIHPVQYILVSFALILFYTLLIALSEYINFHIAYLISSIAIVLMITLYVRSIFAKTTHTLIIGAFVAGLYTYLYIMLQLEGMSLLIGAIGLFVALAAVMYTTRKIDWYKPKEENTSQSSINYNQSNQYPPQQ